MTSKMKILVPIGILIILAIGFGISKWSSEKKTAKTAGDAEMESTQAPEPTGSVDDLFLAIDASSADEELYVASQADQEPSSEGSEYDQSLNYEI